MGQEISKNYKTGVINDPLGQTHILASSEHCFRLKFVLFCKVGTDGRTDEWMTCAKPMVPTAMTMCWPSGSTYSLQCFTNGFNTHMAIHILAAISHLEIIGHQARNAKVTLVPERQKVHLLSVI